MNTKMPDVQSDLEKEVKGLRLTLASLFMEIKDFKRDGLLPEEGAKVLRSLEQKLGLVETQVRLQAGHLKELETKQEHLERQISALAAQDRDLSVQLIRLQKKEIEA